MPLGYYIEEIQKEIKLKEGCDSIYLESVHVKEVRRDQIVWKGSVEVFQLHGHPKAERCYAWGYGVPGQVNYVIALETPKVNSPLAAVRVFIAAEKL